MDETIFDLIEEPMSEGKEGYFKLAQNAPEPKDDSFLNSIADYAKTFIKGGIEGVSKLGRIMGPLQDPKGRSSEQILEEQTEVLNKLLPTDENFTQKAIRRGLGQAPIALASPWSTLSTLPRAMAAGFFGEGAKELELPEWAQAAAELTAYIGRSEERRVGKE